MRPISHIRRQNLASLVEATGGQAPLSRLLIVDKNQIYQWLIEDEANDQSRKMSHRTARKIERLTGKPEGWLDADHEAEQSVGQKTESIAKHDESQSSFLRPNPSMMASAYNAAFIHSGLAARKLYLTDPRHMVFVCEIYSLLARGEGVLPGEDHADALTEFARRLPNINGEFTNAATNEDHSKRRGHSNRPGP